MLSLYGKPVFISPLLPRPVYREVAERKWHYRIAYARRVNKKWRKRFGVQRMDDSVLMTGSAIFVSAGAFEKLRRAMARPADDIRRDSVI